MNPKKCHSSDLILDCLGDVLGRALKQEQLASPPARAAVCDHRLVRAIDANRLWPAYVLATRSWDIDPGLEIKKVAAHASARALHHNGRSLATARRVMPLLASSGVRAVVIKGALRQWALYGTPMYRQANDLDILVAPEDYRGTSELLRENGFAPQARCESAWWTDSLGEQHFDPVDRRMSMIDLHHRIHQPGLPGPRDVGVWLADPVTVELGEASIPVPAEPKAILLGCLNLVKAIQHREPAGTYAFEYATALLTGHRQMREDLVRLARDQKLLAVLLFCHAATREACRVELPVLPVRASERLELGAMPLRRMVFAFPDDVSGLPRHRDLLWTLCGASGPMERLAKFSVEAARYARAEARRHTA